MLEKIKLVQAALIVLSGVLSSFIILARQASTHLTKKKKN